jgi:hypothetical protein
MPISSVARSMDCRCGLGAQLKVVPTSYRVFSKDLLFGAKEGIQYLNVLSNPVQKYIRPTTIRAIYWKERPSYACIQRDEPLIFPP